MKNRLSIGVLVLLGIAAAYLYSGGIGEHELVGQPAPGIELALLDGGSMNLADHLGKEIVMLDFWASWCGPCRSSMPAVAEVAKEYADKGVVLYAVNEGEPAEIVRDYIENAHLDITVALDTAWQAGRKYLVEGIPQLVIIDKDGTIANVHVGAGPGLKNKLREELDALLSAENPAAS